MAVKGKGDTVKHTDRQALFLKIKAENPGMTNSEAARKAGYAEATVRSSKVSKGVRTSLQEAMEKAGLTDEYIAKRIHEGTQAFKKTYVNNKHSKDPKTGADIGERLEEKVDLDFRTRATYLELTSKLRGDMVQRVQQENTYPDGVPITLSPKEEKRISKELGTIFGASKQQKRRKK